MTTDRSETETYQMPATRAKPAYFIFLVDQSGSMADPIRGTKHRKCDVVSRAIDRVIDELIVVATKAGSIRDYFYVSVIGYGNDEVRDIFGTATEDPKPIPISVVEGHPCRRMVTEERTIYENGVVVKVPEDSWSWITPHAEGNTPMTQALRVAEKLIARFRRDFARSFPPIVLNFTDGAATDGDPTEAARSAVQQDMEDGRPLILNCCFTKRGGQALKFPSTIDGIEVTDYGRVLHGISSVLPAPLRQRANALDLDIGELTDGARGFIYNAAPEDVVKFIGVGTPIREVVDSEE